MCLVQVRLFCMKYTNKKLPCNFLKEKNMQKDAKLFTLIVVIVIAAFIGLSSFFVVEVGFVGVRINILSGQTKSFPQGTYLKLPLIHQVATLRRA